MSLYSKFPGSAGSSDRCLRAMHFLREMGGCAAGGRLERILTGSQTSQ